MPTFIYKIKRADGSVFEDRRESLDKYSLYRDIKKEGETVISVTEVVTKKTFWKKFLEIGTIKQHDRIVFCSNVASMLEAGLPLSRALVVTERQSHNKRFRTIITHVNEDVKSGKSFSEALAKFPNIFPELFCAMTRAGEESGNLCPSLKALADQMDKMYRLKKRVRGALIYPSIIITLMIVIAILLLIFVVPTLTSVFKEMKIDLPITTKAIIFASDFFKNQYIYLLPAAGFIFLGLYFMFKIKKTKKMIHFTLLHIPIIGGIIKEINSARTARTLSSLLSSGVEFLRAIEITRDVVQNIYHRNVLDEAKAKVQKGEPISAVFSKNENLYPPFVSEMINVGEESGKLTTMLSEVAVYYENEVEQKTKDISTIIEPMLMVLIGIAVAFFAISMLQPTYSLISNI